MCPQPLLHFAATLNVFVELDWVLINVESHQYWEEKGSLL